MMLGGRCPCEAWVQNLNQLGRHFVATFTTSPGAQAGMYVLAGFWTAFVTGRYRNGGLKARIGKWFGFFLAWRQTSIPYLPKLAPSNRRQPVTVEHSPHNHKKKTHTFRTTTNGNFNLILHFAFWTTIIIVVIDPSSDVPLTLRHTHTHNEMSSDAGVATFASFVLSAARAMSTLISSASAPSTSSVSVSLLATPKPMRASGSFTAMSCASTPRPRSTCRSLPV